MRRIYRILCLTTFRVLKRQVFLVASGARGKGQSVDQTVYSDGLSTLSVFVQKAKAGQSMPNVPMAHGAVVSRSQTVGNYLVTALGEVPLVTLNQVLKSVQWKSQ
ncbi:MucB/RseB C-terminal domain-containing protein [Limnobacter sp.]|uniref:MucB/RseB C-terminal domain-containing protein n=1 Tax=Limnobacter sp. TaxID=2003368 RepID=UPI00338E229A